MGKTETQTILATQTGKTKTLDFLKKTHYTTLVQKFKKRDVIERLIEVPKTQKRPFWAREMKMLNTLMEEFTDQTFWQKVNFQKKYDSLAYFISHFGKKTLRKKYNEYNYKIPLQEKIKLGDKVGEDKKFKKKNKTVRDFFNE